MTQATASAYTITWPSQSIVYGTAIGGASGIKATASIAGSFSYSPAAGTVLPVSATPVVVTATFTPTDTTDYAGQSATASITVTPAVLTVKAVDATRAYGAADPTFTDTITGYVNGDTSSVITGTASLTSTDTATSPVGSYPITAAVGTLTAKNYSFVFTPGTLTVTQATASAYTITWPSQSIVYGTAIGGASGIKATASIAGSFSYSPAAGTVLPVSATPVVVTATFTPTDTTDYAGQTATASITVTPAVLTVKAVDATRAYGAADPTFTDTITGYVNGDTSSVITGTASLTSTDTATSPVGSYPITAAVGTLTAKNYSFVFTPGTLTVTQATATITWVPTTVTYGTAIGSSTLAATSSVGGSFTYNPAAGTVLNVGTTSVTVTFTPTDTKDYTPQTATAAITVTPAALTLTANNVTRAYNTPNPAFTGTITGAVNGDIFTESFSTTAVLTSSVGSYPITPTATGANLGNYTLATTPGTLTIAAANANITWAPAPVTYGSATVGTGSLVATSSVGGTFTYNPVAGTVLNAGSTSVTAIFTPTDTKNYTTQTVTATVVVNPATLTLTAASATRAYNTPNPAFTGTIAGAVNGDTFTESFSTTAVLTSGVGPYPITPTAAGTNLSNYTLASTPGTLTITQAAAVITWPPTTVTYGASTIGAGSLVATSSVGGTFTYSPVAGTVLNVGATPVTVTFTPTDTKDYTTQTTTATITVTPATLTVTAANATRSYGATNPTFTASATGAVNGDTFTYSETTPATAASAIGTYPIVPVAAGTHLSNYTVVYVNGTLTIGQAALTVTAADANRNYGVANPTFSASAAGAVNGDTFTYAETTPATITSSVGTYPIVPVATGTNLSNYTVVYVNGTLTVNQATLTVTAANATRTYGATNPVFSASAVGAVNGDTFTYTETTPATNTSSVGTYPIIPVAVGTNLADYNVVYNNGTLTVSQATLTVTAGDSSRTYGATNPTFTATEVGAVNGDTFTYTETTTAIASSPVGTYPIVPVATGTNLADYTVVYNNGTLTVSKATLTVTAVDANRVYGAQNPTFSAAASGTENSDIFTFTETTVATPASPVGAYPIVPVATGANLSNYTVTYVNGILTVGQATLTVTAGSATRIYGASNPTFSASAIGAANGDTFTFTETTPATSASPVGIYPITSIATGMNLTDYNVVYINGTLTVGQATLTVTAANAGREYGIDNPPFTATSTGSVNGDTFTLTETTPATIASSVGTYPIVPVATGTNLIDYNVIYVNGTLTIGQATLTVTANNFTKLYGTPNPPFTGSITGALDGDTFTEIFSNSASIPSQPGQYPIIPAATGTNVNDYIQVVQNGMLTVTKAPAITTLSLSTTNIAYDLPVTFTANVASTTSGQPTGTVSLFDNGNALATATLTNGVASYSTTALSVGTHVITAVYSGDVDFNSSTASATSGANTITITPLDFTITLTSAATVEGTYGTTRQYTFHITPIGGTYPGTVQLSASPTGPILATYTFSPAEIAKMAGPTDITLTVATRKLASLDSPKDLSSRFSRVALGLFLLPLLGLRYSRRSGRKLTRMITYSILILSSLGAIGTLTGCGSGYFDRTYPITVTAVSNGIQHTVSVDFHIDQSPQ